MSHDRVPRKPSQRSRQAPPGDRARGPAGEVAGRGSGRLGAHYAGGPAVPLGATVQRKVAIGRVGDRYEQEADAVAERVTRGESAPAVSRIPPGGLGPTAQRAADEKADERAEEKEQTAGGGAQEQALQRAAAAGKAPAENGEETKDEGGAAAGETRRAAADSGEEEKKEEGGERKVLQKAAGPEEEQEKGADRGAVQQEAAAGAEKEDEAGEEKKDEAAAVAQRQADDEESTAQTAPAAAAGAARKPALAARAIADRGAGQPLAPATRSRLESGMGVDLGDVRVHEDPRSRQASRDLGARAFAHRNSIWLGPGESQSDLRLMAHETTHVLQQDGVVRRKPRPEGEAADERGRRGHGVAAGDREAAGREGAQGSDAETAGAAGPAGAAERLPRVPAGPAGAPGAKAVAGRGASRPAAPRGAEAGRKPVAGRPSTGAEGEEATGAAPVEDEAPAAGKEPAEGKGPPQAGGPGEGAGGAAGEASGAGGAAGGEKSAAAGARAAGTRTAGPAAVAAPAPAAAGGAAMAAAPSSAGVLALAGATAAQPASGKATAGPRAGAEPGGEKGARGRAGTRAGADGRPAAPAAPGRDRRFQGVMRRLGEAAASARRHRPASEKVADAQAAAEAPGNDRSSRAQAAQVEVMDRQEAGKPDPDDFLTLLRAELRRIAPANMEQTEEFKEKGRAGELKESLTGKVAGQKEASASAIRGATEAEPDAGSVAAKPVVPLPEEPADPAAPELSAGEVLPTPKAPEEVSVEANRERAETLMADNDIDAEQLERANEPQFQEAIAAKKELDADVEAVPAAYREQERSQLAVAEAEVEGRAAAAQTAMAADRANAKTGVAAEQQEAKKKEEEERGKVAGQVEGMYAATRKKVEDKLADLDGEVGQLFDSGEKAARERFESDVDRKMSDYKWERYISQVGGSVLWASDKLFGMPDEVNRFYEQGRDQYIEDMDAVLVAIAGTVELRLAEAKQDIADGKEEIRKFVETLPESLAKAGREAEEKVGARFGDLEAGVEAKKGQLARQMAERYQESRAKLDERIAELKAQNQGLLDAFIGKLLGIIEILRNFRDRVMGLFKAGADVIRRIVKDPVAFLGNLLAAVRKGFDQFVGRILMHLKKGLMAWLLGTLSEAGIEVPSELSLKSVFGLVLQVMGITRERLRAKLAKIVGEKNVARLESAWGVVSKLVAEGPAGLWARARELLGNLKETVLGGIRDFVAAEVVKQGVLWVLSLLNPASALLRAIKLIIDVATFFVENIQRILEVVETVVRSTAQIAAGNIAAAADWIEGALGRTVPVVIGFLARLLGLGGLAGRIQEIIQRLQKRVDEVIDKVLGSIVGKVKGLFGRGRAGRGAPAAKPKSAIEAQHGAIATAVANELARQPAGELSYQEVRRQKMARARQLEELHSAKLGKGVSLKVLFQPPEKDLADGDLDFKVWIGPNATVKSGSVKTVALPKLGKPVAKVGGKLATLKVPVHVGKPGAVTKTRVVLTQSLQRHHYNRIQSGGPQPLNSIMHYNLFFGVIKSDLEALGATIQGKLSKRVEKSTTTTESVKADYAAGGRRYKVDQPIHFFVTGGPQVWGGANKDQWMAARGLRKVHLAKIKPADIRRMKAGTPPPLKLPKSPVVNEAVNAMKTAGPGSDGSLKSVSGQDRVVDALRTLA